MLRRSAWCWLPLLAFYPTIMQRGFATLSVPKVSIRLDSEPLQGPLVTDAEVRTVRRHQVRKRESLKGILGRWGLSRSAIQSLARSWNGLLRGRYLVSGTTVRGTFLDDGQLLRLEVPLDEERILLVQRAGDGQVQARIERLQLERRLVCYEASLHERLLGREARAAGIPASLQPVLVELYASLPEPPAGQESSNSIRLVAEAFYHRGKLVKHGSLLAAELTTGGRAFPVFRFQGRYYDADGRSLRKDLLRSPLLEYRITSSFQSRRMHPILGRNRPHRGVDLAAPAGTPVRAVGDGRIVFAGQNGGYGRMVQIRHDEAYASLYAHLSRFAPGLEPGARVRQGDIIGFVGQSGLATAPHVHYELLHEGRFVNPMAVELPEAPPVAAADRPAFDRTARSMRALLSRTLPGLAQTASKP